MKLCSFLLDNATRIGAVTPRGVADLSALGIIEWRDVYGADLAGLQRNIDDYAGEYLDIDTLNFANISNPSKIVCVGLNYTDHAEETGGEAPTYPVLFSKFSDTLTPAGAAVALPEWQRSYDYEAELVIIVGKSAYNVAERDADECIFGYACGDDLSARDAQFLSNQWLAGKSYPGFAPAGPIVATRESVDPDTGLRITCEVNGTRVQDGNTRNMIFSCRAILSACSRHFALEPGDLIFTGTPAGVILGKPKGSRTWLKPGDVVAVEIEGLGKLVTPLV
jgi:2-keto-4-pentenoate hydratase/2-oxohepta-3-ene-1,7-dioic acid hydratase in catechol pathway